MRKANTPEGWAFNLDPFWDKELNEGKDWRELGPYSKKKVVLSFEENGVKYTHEFYIKSINNKVKGKFKYSPKNIPPHRWETKRPFIPGLTDFASLYPELAKEFVTTIETMETDPSKLECRSLERALWRCEKGHLWAHRIQYRTYHESTCPWCGVKDSFVDRYPEVLDIWSGRNFVDPRSLPLKINFPIQLTCEEHPLFPYETTPERYNRGMRCTICDGKQRLPRDMTFSDTLIRAYREEFIPMHDKTHIDDARLDDDSMANWKCPYGKLWACTFAERWNGAQCSCVNCRRDLTRALVPSRLGK